MDMLLYMLFLTNQLTRVYKCWQDLEIGPWISKINGKTFFAVKGGCIIQHPDGTTQFIANRNYCKYKSL